MEKNLQLQYMESSNEVDFLIYEVLDPTPLLSTLEDGRAKKYQNKAEMESNCNRIVKCVNAHEELVTIAKRAAFIFGNEANYPYGTVGYLLCMDAQEILKKVTDNTPTEV